ncbi:MAG: DUF1329 domain-containing protein [Colwellia sp.]|nr:DUF1329 domain-containing protein [Colwellia sp.]
MKYILLSLLILSLTSHGQEYPAVGTVLTKDNVAHYSNFIDEPLSQLIKQGYVTITVGETFTVPMNENFAIQTKKYQNTATINHENGNLLNYKGGLPFSNSILINDEQAGLKIAWNMRYAYGGDSSIVDPFIWDYRNMKNDKIERTISFVGKTLRYKHRVSSLSETNLPDNKAGIFSAIYLLAKKPYDFKNTQLLVHRLEDDSARERTWLYLSVQRRVRRLPSGQSTDAFLGSDIMIEDFLGYNGRIMDMKWKLLTREEILVPFFKHNQLTADRQGSNEYDFGQFHGRGNCFPNVPWQVRKVYKLEAIPKWAQHPLSKRIFYVDAETFTPVLGRFYDRSGDIWRMAIGGFSHPDYHLSENKGTGVMIPSLISMIDVQAQHCTTLKMKTSINSANVTRKNFTVQYLRTKGK